MSASNAGSKKLAGIREAMATLQIGKKGVTEEVIKEAKTQLKIKEYIKVKMLKNMKEDKNKAIQQLLKQTKAELVDKRGNVFIIKKVK